MYTLQNFKAEIFKALAHPLRIRILENLRESAKNVTELQNVLHVDQSTLSQQLGILRSKNLINMHKNGTSVFYNVNDPLLFELLDITKKIFNNHLILNKDLFELMEKENNSSSDNGKIALQ